MRDAAAVQKHHAIDETTQDRMPIPNDRISEERLRNRQCLDRTKVVLGLWSRL